MPRYKDVIPTKGPNGNIHAILACAEKLLCQYNVSTADIDQLIMKVLSSKSYAQAKGHIKVYFNLEDDL